VPNLTVFQTRSQVDMLDGHRLWKYGQKTVKNKMFPRLDEETIVTTYEGIHSHLIEKPPDRFETILKQMHFHTPF
ncbi:hypothetical protein RJ641_008987, partial [Dillenia turbinata]